MIAVPSGVFKPYAGVNTAILIFTKGGETNNAWFYDMQADNYTLDDKRNKITESDLPDIVQRYKNRLNQNTLSESGFSRLKNEQDFANNKTSKISTPTSGKSSNSENPDSDRRNILWCLKGNCRK